MPDVAPSTQPLETDGSVAVDETDRLIASDKVAGTDVYDAAGQRIGTVHNFMVDKVTGQVAYAVLAVGGFLGLGEQRRAVAWQALTYDPEKQGYVVASTAFAARGESPAGLSDAP